MDWIYIKECGSLAAEETGKASLEMGVAIK